MILHEIGRSAALIEIVKGGLEIVVWAKESTGAPPKHLFVKSAGLKYELHQLRLPEEIHYWQNRLGLPNTVQGQFLFVGYLRLDQWGFQKICIELVLSGGGVLLLSPRRVFNRNGPSLFLPEDKYVLKALPCNQFWGKEKVDFSLGTSYLVDSIWAVFLMATLLLLNLFGQFRFVILLYTYRLGHLIEGSEIYFAEKAQGLHGDPQVRDIHLIIRSKGVHKEHLIANPRVSCFWPPEMILIQLIMVNIRSVVIAKNFFPGHFIVLPFHDRSDTDIHAALDATPVRLETKKPESFYFSDGRHFGLRDFLDHHSGRKMALLHFRLNGYMKNIYKNYTDQTEKELYAQRNVDPYSYDAAIKWLTENDYIVIRVGKESIPWHYRSAATFDYAVQAHDSLLDFYLFSKCEFFLGSTSGVFAYAQVYRKPILFTNYELIGGIRSSSKRYLTIPRKIWSSRDNRYWSLAEQLNHPVGWNSNNQYFVENGFELHPNSECEILKATQQMVASLSGEWKETPTDKRLQQLFWECFPNNDRHSHFESKIGSYFLESNKQWLFPDQI